MSTTDQREPTSATTEATHRRAPAAVATLDELKRRKWLHTLEANRSHLAMIAGQQRSHDLDEAEDTLNLQLGIEATIRDEFPDEYEELFPLWLHQDLTAEHPRAVLIADCGICRSIATAHGLNLLPPEAA